ncbi:hypothetical protein RRG08_024529 [Elysia crispata]|uniref:Uncharacterized protein n=1 Tax=Elysia crispata TaxID=231223 RepID=A0AAE0Y7G7_9GAST|nr:hypothetical protein RRG08_024529 [Elysia crispata]
MYSEDELKRAPHGPRSSKLVLWHRFGEDLQGSHQNQRSASAARRRWVQNISRTSCYCHGLRLTTAFDPSRTAEDLQRITVF